MSDLYHVNPVTFEVGTCHALTGRCPFGIENHYSYLKHAERAAESMCERESKLFALTAMHKSDSDADAGDKPQWYSDFLDNYNSTVDWYHDYDESLIDAEAEKHREKWEEDRAITEELMVLDVEPEPSPYMHKPSYQSRLRRLNQLIDGFDQNIEQRHQAFRDYETYLRDYKRLADIVSSQDIGAGEIGMRDDRDDIIACRALYANQDYIHEHMFPSDYEWDATESDYNMGYNVDYMNDDIAVIRIYSCCPSDEMRNELERYKKSLYVSPDKTYWYSETGEKEPEFDEDDIPEMKTWYFVVNPHTGEMLNKENWVFVDSNEDHDQKSFQEFIIDGLDSDAVYGAVHDYSQEEEYNHHYEIGGTRYDMKQRLAKLKS